MKKMLSPFGAIIVFLVLPFGLSAESAGKPLYVPGPFKFSRPDSEKPVDGEWYRSMQVQCADLFNGGPDGLRGQGAYLPDFSGYVESTLNREWYQGRSWGGTTIIAQARAVFANVEAYVASGEARFLATAEKEADFMLKYFKDGKNGGFYWQVEKNGSVREDYKQGYGQMHALLVLSRLASVSKDPKYLKEAGAQLDIVQSKITDPDYPGAVIAGRDKTFNSVMGNKNIDTFTHYFETLQAYWDVAPAQRKAEVGALIVKAGDLLVNKLAVPMAGKPNLKYVSYNYADDWTPSKVPYTRDKQWSGAGHASSGHTMELAFLLSRAVERGFDKAWLSAARSMLDYCLAYAIDPITGGMRHDTLEYDGTPLKGNPDNAYYIYWAMGETVRCLMHFSVLRDPSLVPAFRKAQAFMADYLIDREFGDWYPEIVADTLKPNRGDKGDNWKGDYHEAMLFAEGIRLSGLKKGVSK